MAKIGSPYTGEEATTVRPQILGDTAQITYSSGSLNDHGGQHLVNKCFKDHNLDRPLMRHNWTAQPSIDK